MHLNQYEHFRRIPLEKRLHSLLDSMKNYNVDYSLVLTSYKVTSYRPSTSKVLEITQKYDNLGVVAGFSIDNHNKEDLQNCRRWFRDGLIKAIKLYCGYEHYYPYDKKYQQVYDLCVEFNAPVMIHTGDTFLKQGKLRFSHPINIDDVAVDNPDLKIVICHLGNPWFLDCGEILYKNENVYADISGFFLRSIRQDSEKYLVKRVTEFLNYIGREPTCLLYGTDWPISDMGVYLNFLQKIELNTRDRDLIMSKNAKKLFGI
ncbi:MAG: amidohydrolase family protein [Candidatus Nitrosopolaris sp.]